MFLPKEVCIRLNFIAYFKSVAVFCDYFIKKILGCILLIDCKSRTLLSNKVGSDQSSLIWSKLFSQPDCLNINPITLRKTKIVYNVGLSECIRVNDRYIVLYLLYSF